ncbi:MAG: hypothetical protein AAF556_02265 [Pseudomonadota bacterium]
MRKPMTFSQDLIWWITIVELPVMTALALFIWRTRNDASKATLIAADRARTTLQQIQAELAAFKLEVARSYASVALLKDTEKRLTHHLLRIEAKLDSRVFQHIADDHEAPREAHAKAREEPSP